MLQTQEARVESQKMWVKVNQVFSLSVTTFRASSLLKHSALPMPITNYDYKFKFSSNFRFIIFVYFYQLRLCDRGATDRSDIERSCLAHLSSRWHANAKHSAKMRARLQHITAQHDVTQSNRDRRRISGTIALLILVRRQCFASFSSDCWMVYDVTLVVSIQQHVDERVASCSS